MASIETLEHAACDPPSPLDDVVAKTTPTHNRTTAEQIHPQDPGCRPIRVILVGPGPEQMGGMASVVQQMLSLDFSGQYRPDLLATTHATDPRERLFARCRRHLRQIRELKGTIRNTPAPIVHIHTCSGISFFRSAVDMIVAQRSGARVILHIHGATFDRFFETQPSMRKRWIAWILARADTVIALSRQWALKLQDMASTARIVVVENAVSIPTLRQAQTVGGPCRFALLARMDQWKGIGDALQACSILHESGASFSFTLAGPPGTAGDAASIERNIHDLRLSEVVRYVGPLEGSAKNELLAHTDVYVQPSHSEGMPIAVLEAMAHGLPIVATRVGAIPEMIEDGVHGRLVPARRPKLLAEAMRTLLTEQHKRRTMGNACRTLAQTRFSLNRLADDLTRLYQNL